MEFFSTQNILVHIPLGKGGYDLVDRGCRHAGGAALHLAGQSGEDR